MEEQNKQRRTEVLMRGRGGRLYLTHRVRVVENNIRYGKRKTILVEEEIFKQVQPIGLCPRPR